MSEMVVFLSLGACCLLGLVFPVWTLVDPREISRQRMRQSWRRPLVLSGSIMLVMIASLSLAYKMGWSPDIGGEIILLNGVFILINAYGCMLKLSSWNGLYVRNYGGLVFLGIITVSLALTVMISMSDLVAKSYTAMNPWGTLFVLFILSLFVVLLINVALMRALDFLLKKQGK